jgi:hypothetical protein
MKQLPSKQRRTSRIAAFSAPPSVVDRAIADAAARGLTFSEYIRLLITAAKLPRKVRS